MLRTVVPCIYNFVVCVSFPFDRWPGGAEPSHPKNLLQFAGVQLRSAKSQSHLKARSKTAQKKSQGAASAGSLTLTSGLSHFSGTGSCTALPLEQAACAGTSAPNSSMTGDRTTEHSSLLPLPKLCRTEGFCEKSQTAGR